MSDRFTRLVLGVFLAIMLGWILVIGRPVILPIVASLIVAYIVLGLTELFARLPLAGPRMPTALRLALAVVAIVGALVLLVSVIIGNVGLIVADAPQYQDRLLALIQTGAVKLGFETEPTWRTLRDQALAQVNFQRLFGAALASASTIVATTTIVLIYAGFMLAEKNAFAQKIARLSDDPARVARIREIIGAINSRVGAYLVTKTLINVLLGALSYAVLRVFGVQYAGFWAILIGLFNYIPYVGGFVGVSLPVALAVVQFGALGPALGLTAALSAAQVAIGNFLEPWLMGASLNLSPLVILVSLVVWTALWGIPGAILSVPIMAILVIVLSEFDGARPIAVLLSKDGDIATRRDGRG
jgi:AI-2 transport protein TqsA